VRRIRLAIVDDHTIVREGLSRVLGADPGLEIVGGCGDGAGALDLVSRLTPDVLLLDLALPDSDGLDLIGPIAQRSPETKVLILSMFSEPEYAAAAHDRGAWGLVAKSSSPEALIEAIRSVAEGSPIPVEQALTPREQEIMMQLAAGKSNDEVASALGIQRKTVEGYCQRLMDKLGTHTRAGLIAHARRANFY
jgi:DNA-binding NarL/FixJ family response regulator